MPCEETIGECNVCHKTAWCLPSTDMNGDGDGGQGTGLICDDCAAREHMVECARCGEMRYEENTTDIVGKRGRFCLGCADDEVDADEEEDE